MAALLKGYKHGWEKLLGVDDEIATNRHRYSPTSLNNVVKTKNRTINAEAKFYGLYKGLTLQKLLHPDFLHQDLHLDLQEARDYIHKKRNFNTNDHLYEIKRFVENKENPNYDEEISTLKKHITPEFRNNSDLLNHINMIISSIQTSARSATALGEIHMETRGGRRQKRKTRKTRR